ncbi:cell division topological specificity factor MinE [Pontibaca methylaminivorans]|uniref:cell division topological specificity factor MinE n=1 Tax=Pontibaca methylaminivorans TaxID=515897 RepID=UPI002FDB90B3
MFGFSFRPRKARSAETARDRLQILLAHERSGPGPDCLPELQRDILAAIRRHLKIDNDDAVDIRMDRGDELSSLEINIEFPATQRR